MTTFKYILKSLKFYKRQHLAVLLGTIISTAVLGGALIVGDSVKLSLKHLVDLRLGKVQYAMQTGDRFVRSDLATDISLELGIKSAAVMQLQGIAANQNSGKRVNQANIIGIDQDFWELSDIEMSDLKKDDAIISRMVADRLGLKIEDSFLLKVEKASIIPLNAPFAEQEESSVSFRLKVKAIAENEQLGRFSLKSNQAAPYNIFINRSVLTEKLYLNNLSNLILVKYTHDISESDLNKSVSTNWKLEDAGLHFREIDDNNFELISNRIFIDHPIAEAISKTPSSAILTYLVNGISYQDKTTPYSFVSAISEYNSDLKENEIVINSWLAEDLGLNIHDTINLDYFIIGSLRKLTKETTSFIIKDIIPVVKNISNELLMPDFPGLADAGSCSDWETGIPIDLAKIRDKDEKYWDNFKGTPKAFISLKSGHKLWNNQFGNFTAFRFGQSATSKATVQELILSELKPMDLNLRFENVRTQGQKAATKGVDFGELFLSLSFFVIAAGVLLTILIYALNTEARSKETGILAGLGFSRKQIIKVRLYESSFIIILGGVAGTGFGVLYNYGLMTGLNSVWQGAVRTQMLDVYILPSTLIIGALIGMTIAFLSIVIVSYRKLKSPVAALIKEHDVNSPVNSRRKKKLNLGIGISATALALFMIIYGIMNSIDLNASLFLSAGAIMIIGLIFLMAYYLYHLNDKNNNISLSFIQLAIKNTSRNKGRSLTTITLLALGTFSILITGSNRKTFIGTENNRHSGTGGFTYWAETSIPILNDLNTDEGKIKYGLDEETTLNNTHFVQLLSREGDDASCLNLNQVSQARILGINPDELNRLNAFSFAKLIESVIPSNPWLALNTDLGSDVIPAFADQTVIQWGLIKKIGDTLYYHDEYGKEIKLLLMGGLNASILQGHVLIADKYFTRHFPSVGGSKTMLIDTDQKNEKAVKELLETYLVDYGFEAQSTSERLAEFYSITNTYLTVFMVLGGLGLIIGTIGLGIVILRNMLDRKHEFALLQSLGYNRKTIFRLVLSENIFLLIGGILIGISGAVTGMLPSILSPSFDVPWGFTTILLFIIVCSGLLWIYLPTKYALKRDLMKGLRNE
ncbi:MAG: FtsX-like permease family protein [Bacteroidales bacterium]|nr:FtsX-like permease family protein [Bacteroidales bacterium]